MTTCIYCRERSAKRFPSEHVIPRSFGKFSQNLTIHCVCGECNNFFSGHLEIHFARHTGEGVVRYRHGLRKSLAPNPGNEKFTATISTPGKLFGAQVRLTPNATGDGIGFDWISQVGFEEKMTGNWLWFTEDKLEPRFLREVRFGSKVCYVTPNAEARQRLRNKLIEMGFKFGTQQHFDEVAPQTTLATRVKWDFDAIIRRCLAKIAFNHLAHITGQDPDFLCRSDFDDVRNFIRFGTKSEKTEPNLVLMSGVPQLGYSSPPPLGGGHLILTTWDATNRSIISHLSIFGVLTYRVILCRDYDGIWFDIRAGHYFDPTQKAVRPARITRLDNILLL